MRHYWLTCDAPDLPGNAFRKAFGRNRPETLEGKGGGAPAPPDPFQTAAATTQTNEATAAYNKALNLNNYQNPFGSQTTVQTGVDPTTGAPIYNSVIQTLPQTANAIGSLLDQTGQSGQINSNALNGLYGLGQQYQGLNSGIGGLQGQYAGLNQNITGLAPQYSSINGQLGGLGSQYSNLNGQYSALGSQLNQGQAAQAGQQGQNAAYAAQTQYLDPQFSQQGESLSAQLANQGLAPGSQAYNNAMTNFNNQKQQAYSNAQNESILTGSQIGAQNLSNQIAGINTQAGLLGAQGQGLGAQAGLYGQQASNIGQQAGLFGLAGTNLGQQSSLYGLQGQNLNSQAGLYGQQVGIGQTPYSNLSSIASLVPGYTGTAPSSAAPANIAQYQNNAYQGQLAGYNADVSSSNATTSALGTLAGAAAIAFF